MSPTPPEPPADDDSVDDFVAELRLAVTLQPDRILRDVAWRAADEIERLRAELNLERRALELAARLLDPEAPR